MPLASLTHRLASIWPARSSRLAHVLSADARAESRADEAAADAAADSDEFVEEAVASYANADREIAARDRACGDGTASTSSSTAPTGLMPVPQSPRTRAWREVVTMRRGDVWRWWWRRVPVIRQQDAVECGAACLAMVLGYFGCARALARCRAVCDPGRDGISAQQLIDAARMLGLWVDAWIIDHAGALSESGRQLPAIVHWHGTHYVVIERVGRRSVTIVDPAYGRRRLSREEADACCSGVALTFTPGPAFERLESGVRHWWLRFAFDLLRAPGAWSMFALLIVATLVLQACGLVLPLATQLIVDRVIPGQLASPLSWLAAGGLLVVVSQTMVRYVRSYAVILLQGRVETRLTHQFLSHVLRLPFRFFLQRAPGDLLTRVSGLSTVRELITAHSVGVGLDTLFVAGYLLLLAAWSPLFAALAVGVSVVQVAVLALTRPALQGVTERHLTAQAEAHGCLVEALRGMVSVKVAGAEQYVLGRWAALFDRQRTLAEARQQRAAMFDAALAGLRLCATLAFLWLGAHEVLAGQLTVGTMLALNALAAGALTPLGSLVGSLQQFQMARAQLERIRDVLESPLEQVPAARPLRPTLAGGLRVERLAFRYQRAGPRVLDDITFTARAGEAIAIVGRSGSGKSTLARLLVGLHEPEEGRVLLDGWALRGLDFSQVRRQCGVVLQESVVFNLTIRENIAFGREGLAFEDVMRAASTAGLHDEIMRMLMGYDTVVLDSGIGLSGGQRQRLLIARAVAHRPALLVLDEATSHLDAETERHIAARLRALTCTRVIIAHRIATVRDADLVLVLDRGRLIEQGRPEALIAQRGLYATLVDEQRVHSISS